VATQKYSRVEIDLFVASGAALRISQAEKSMAGFDEELVMPIMGKSSYTLLTGNGVLFPFGILCLISYCETEGVVFRRSGVH
jgi:hypothetical protein